MASIDTLVSDIYAFMQGDGRFPPPTKDHFDQLGKAIADVCYARFIERHERAKQDPSFTLRMSNYGLPIRKLQYEAKYPTNEKYDGPTLLKFLVGDITEAILLFIAESTGHTVEHRQTTLEIDGIEGHPDALIDGVLVDVKSCSSRAFRDKFMDGSLFNGNDSFAYFPQIKSYEEALKVSDSGFLASNKETGELCFLRTPKHLQYAVKEKIADTKKALEPDAPLAPRCYPDVEEDNGNRTLGSDCGWCRFKTRCWSDANGGRGLRAFKYSNGVKYFTNVYKTPKVQEINLDPLD